MIGYFFPFLLNTAISLLYPTAFLFCIIIFSLIFWNKKITRILLGIGLIYFYFSANGMIPKILIKHLEDPFKPISDQKIISHRAMIVLGGGISRYPDDIAPLFISNTRILEVYRIYKVAKAHHIQYTIFLSGGYTNKNKSISEASLYKKILLQFGIPDQYLITEEKSMNTYQNGQYLKPLLKKHPFKEYVLVTGAPHMRRAIDYLNHFNIKTVPAPSDYPYPIMYWLPLAYNLSVQSMALHEYIGILRFGVYNWLHINSPA